MPGSAAKPVISTGAMISTLSPSAPSRVSATNWLGTRCANGSPGATSPMKLRNSGREMSPLPESVIFICRTGSAPIAIAVHTPSSTKMRRTPAAMAEARWSLGTENGRRSSSATRRPFIERVSATAMVRPTGPPPTITMSKLLAIRSTPRCRYVGLLAARCKTRRGTQHCCTKHHHTNRFCSNSAHKTCLHRRSASLLSRARPSFLNRIIRLAIAATVWHAT